MGILNARTAMTDVTSETIAREATLNTPSEDEEEDEGRRPTMAVRKDVGGKGLG